MSGFGVGDEDRNRFVEHIETAYVQGRLGAADRELRLSRALSAASLGELEALTRDLQVPGTPEVAEPRPAPHVAPHRPAPRPVRSGRLLATVVIAVVGLLGLGIASTLLATFSSSVDESSGESESESAPAVPVEGSGDGQAQGARFEMVPDRVRNFLRRYESKFGTRDSYSLVLYPTRAIVQVPVRGPQPRYERWSYDGTWQRNAEATAVMSPAEIVDLRAVDVGRLFANIVTAGRTLRVQGGELTHVVVHHWRNEPASVNIYIGNSFNESGYLRTTPSGVEIRRYPYRS